jgi:hypothetical protein
MSLTRDRYEQVVRFSWLARQSDDGEMQKFYAHYHARANKIFRSLKDQAKAEFDKMVDSPPEWTTLHQRREGAFRGLGDIGFTLADKET